MITVRPFSGAVAAATGASSCRLWLSTPRLMGDISVLHSQDSVPVLPSLRQALAPSESAALALAALAALAAPPAPPHLRCTHALSSNSDILALSCRCTPISPDPLPSSFIHVIFFLTPVAICVSTISLRRFTGPLHSTLSLSFSLA